VDGALDITNPEAVASTKTLIDEYAEVSSGSTYWNLGADEFVNFEQMANYPALQEAAQARYGAGATGFDLLTAFANDIGAYVQSKGFAPRVWNDGMLRSTFVSLDTDIQITWWTNWSPQMALLQTALDGGYDLVNFNDSLFYYVLGENAGYSYPTTAKVWDRDWQPGAFPTRQGGVQSLVQPYPDQLLGASFAIWSDRPDAQTQEQVAAGIRSPLRAMAERSWNAGSAINLTQFSSTDLLI
jgi:hexosaminidase